MTAPRRDPEPIGFGNCWVVAGIVVQLPFWTRPVCLPVLARGWHPRRTGKIAFARQMVEAIAERHPDRVVHAVRDAVLRRGTPTRPGPPDHLDVSVEGHLGAAPPAAPANRPLG